MNNFKCPHNEFQAIGDEAYCRQCKSLIFSVEETKRREMKLAKYISLNPKIMITIKFLETFIKEVLNLLFCYFLSMLTAFFPANIS